MSVIRECAQGHQFEGLSPGPCPYCLGQLWRIDKRERGDGEPPSAAEQIDGSESA